MKLIDLKGQKFGKLTVVERAGSKNGQAAWHCKCDCGNMVVICGGNLRNGGTTSCNCRKKEGNRKTHGMSYDPIFNIYRGMIRRTTNPKYKQYRDYGGRGITVYPDWVQDFQAFYDYVSKLPHFGEKGYSLDRIDNNGNYEPGNLRWATKAEQNRNTRQNVLVEYQNCSVTLSELSKFTGIPYPTLQRRYHHGDRAERLIRPIETKYRNK